jgi:low temperature requirement protein LtrA
MVADWCLAVTFTLSWKIWNDMAMIIAWFETDDIFQRVSILFLLACLFGYTTNIVEAFSHTYATLIGFFLAARLYMTAYLFLVALLVPMIRPVMLYYSFIALLNAALWIASIHVSYPNRLALIFCALSLEICGQTSYIALLTLAQRLSPKLKPFTTRALDYSPAINIEHRVERTNAFVSLVFGYTVVAILYQSSTQGIDAIFGKAILALIQPFAFNWLYFELDGDRLAIHAIRRAKISALVWSLAHLLFIMSFILGGGALARLVLSTDIEGAHVENLTETYQARSEEHVKQGIRWFYCGGFGSALLFMGAISMSHLHKDLKGMRLSKRVRLSFRACIGVVMVLLPLAGERLDSLNVVATMTGLIVFSLIVEVWGASRKGTGLVVGRGKPCGYVGRCGKRDLQAVLGEDGRVDVDALGERKGMVDKTGEVVIASM